MVDIAYWDDANGQVTTGQFSISDVSNLGNGAISVDDPLGTLNPGDLGEGCILQWAANREFMEHSGRWSCSSSTSGYK